jgi:hypothetical protein
MPHAHEQDFPYNFEKGVEHHNIWSTVPLPAAQVLQVCSWAHMQQGNMCSALMLTFMPCADHPGAQEGLRICLVHQPPAPGVHSHGELHSSCLTWQICAAAEPCLDWWACMQVWHAHVVSRPLPGHSHHAVHANGH